MDEANSLLPPSCSLWSKSDVVNFYHGALTDQIISCAIAVHKELGPGFLESVYEEAFTIELKHRGITFQRQLPIPIRYQGVVVGMHRLDLVIDQKVVVELKAVKDIDDAHIATCLSYLKATQLSVGLIINFAGARTRIRRVTLSAESDLGLKRKRESDGNHPLNAPRSPR